MYRERVSHGDWRHRLQGKDFCMGSRWVHLKARGESWGFSKPRRDELNLSPVSSGGWMTITANPSNTLMSTTAWTCSIKSWSSLRWREKWQWCRPQWISQMSLTKGAFTETGLNVSAKLQASLGPEHQLKPSLSLGDELGSQDSGRRSNVNIRKAGTSRPSPACTSWRWKTSQANGPTSAFSCVPVSLPGLAAALSF